MGMVALGDWIQAVMVAAVSGKWSGMFSKAVKSIKGIYARECVQKER